MWTYSHTSLPTIWCDLTFLSLALLSLGVPSKLLQMWWSLSMVTVILPCKYPWKEQFASSVPSIPKPSLFSNPHLNCSPLIRGAKGANKFSRPEIPPPWLSCPARSGPRPRRSLHPSPRDAAALPAGRSAFSKGTVHPWCTTHIQTGP